MRYPVILKPEKEGGFLVTFPDVPEAITHGATKVEALVRAADALETALDFYFEEKSAVPMPSPLKRGQESVELPASVSAKTLLYNEMIAQRIRPSELARRMKIPRQEMTRLLDPRHLTKIDSIAAAVHALGKQLEVRLT
jgi:antitoxin HicB